HSAASMFRLVLLVIFRSVCHHGTACLPINQLVPKTGSASTIGVDTSKDTLDVHFHPAGAARHFPNMAKAFVALIARLEENEVAGDRLRAAELAARGARA
ncbi:MAG: hypothetical protein ACRECP_07115, partial [Methylocella sp.]